MGDESSAMNGSDWSMLVRSWLRHGEIVRPRPLPGRTGDEIGQAQPLVGTPPMASPTKGH